MRARVQEFPDATTFVISNQAGIIAGRIVGVTEDLCAIVDYPGNPLGPIAARTIIQTRAQNKRNDLLHKPVLLVLENSDPGLPIIIGIIHDTLIVKLAEETIIDLGVRLRDVAIDGERLVLDARKEVVLRCGKGSIRLLADGKIVIKGTRLVSRASNTNKVRGASVSIN